MASRSCRCPALASADVVTFRRFQSAVPNGRGTFPGVFALTNGLGRGERLSAADRAWWAAANARGDSLYPDPSTVDPSCYDRELNPGARAWFKDSATELLAITAHYLDLLDRYGVPWVELRSAWPGRVVYEDDVQVVAVPYTHAADWRLVAGRPPGEVLAVPAMPQGAPSSPADVGGRAATRGL